MRLIYNACPHVLLVVPEKQEDQTNEKEIFVLIKLTSSGILLNRHSTYYANLG